MLMTRFIDTKTFLQTNRSYDPRLDIPTDGIVIHPHNMIPHDPLEMHDSWKLKAEYIGRMMFADSDDLNEYWTGQWDGTEHRQEVEISNNGETVMCAGIRPYMLPTEGWINYLRNRKTIPSLENGIDAILPEEPLAHTFSGYEERFKELYEDHYGCPWGDPDNSDIAYYRTARLKALLYNRLELELLKTTKEYAKKQGREIDFVVPIHSLFSNKVTGIVAPLGLSLDSGYDGYIGQIWTGPVNWSLNNYDSEDKSFFCSAYALYDYFVQLTVESNKKLWLLVDPVEDDPNHSWSDFRQWYQSCTTAMAMMKDVNTYEIMPWPERIFLSTSYTPGIDDHAAEPAPKDYLTLILSITQMLQDMPEGGEWLQDCADSYIGIAIADSALWQKGRDLQGLYGLRKPLLQQGIHSSSFVMERLDDAAYTNRFKVIVLSYEDWKPYNETMDEHLARWVSAGGTLLILGKGGDGLDMEPSFWWRQKGFSSSLNALLDRLHYAKAQGKWRFGKGTVIYNDVSPKTFSSPNQAESVYLPLICSALETSGIIIKRPGYFAMRRGDYVAVHAEKEPFSMSGTFIDVFSPTLAICDGIHLAERQQSGIFKDISDIIHSNAAPKVLHTTYRLVNEAYSDNTLTVNVKGPAETLLMAQIFTGRRTVQTITASSGKARLNVEWTSEFEKAIRITCPNHPDGVTIAILFGNDLQPS